MKSGSSPRDTRNTFSGFMSRWITPCACAAVSAAQIWRVMCTARRHGSAPSRLEVVERSSPSRYSITRNARPPLV